MSAPYQGLGPTLAECLTAEKIALTAELAQVKAELYEAINARCNCCGWIAGVPFDHEGEPTWSELRDGRDNALRHLEAVLEWSNTERFAGRTRHENDAPSAARAFLLSMREGER